MAQGKRDTFIDTIPDHSPPILACGGWRAPASLICGMVREGRFVLVGFSMDITEHNGAGARCGVGDEAQEHRRRRPESRQVRASSAAAAMTSAACSEPILPARRLRGQVSGARAGTLGAHRGGAGDALELLDGLLDVSKLDAGLVSARGDNRSAWPLCWSRSRLSQHPLAEAKKLNWYIDCVDWAVETDPALLARVIRSGDAIRYTQTGTVSIDEPARDWV